MKDVLLEKVDKAAHVIVAGGIVAFPTETYYGLAVDPFNDEALARLYRLKKRPESKPLLTLIAQREDLPLLVDHTPSALQPFIDLWPAPLTLVFPALASLLPRLTGGTGTIGVRISSHPIAAPFITACETPITATSANITGHPPCTSAAMVRAQFSESIGYILDGGDTPGGLGSTLIGVCNQKPVVLRDGVLPFASLQQLVS